MSMVVRVRRVSVTSAELCKVRALRSTAAVDLFGDRQALPQGFLYKPDFLDSSEEDALLAAIRVLEFHDVRMHGVIARRRVIQYGWKYAFDGARLSEGPELPAFLAPVRTRAAALVPVPPVALSEALLTEYQPGAPIGWHRDAPGFGIVVGISLLSACRFRFRRGPGRGGERVSLTLEPRSAYVLSGPSRTDWQHSIPEVASLRYSITFRTVQPR
jgi:alkylated DNA repair dioxygenase AlkB